MNENCRSRNEKNHFPIIAVIFFILIIIGINLFTDTPNAVLKTDSFNAEEQRLNNEKNKPTKILKKIEPYQFK